MGTVGVGFVLVTTVGVVVAVLVPVTNSTSAVFCTVVFPVPPVEVNSIPACCTLNVPVLVMPVLLDSVVVAAKCVGISVTR